MAFRIQGVPADTFQHLFSKSDDELENIGMKRCVADMSPGYPCRVSLEDADIGETLILGQFEHHPVCGPYRSSGPIYIRETARDQFDCINEVPKQLLTRLLSIRGYDRVGLMRSAEVIEGRDLATVIEGFFTNADIDYIHVHNARPGCFACRVDRA